MEQGITGNPDQLKAEELQERAWPIMEPHFRESQETAAANYREMLSKGRASHDIKEIIVAAGQGRVDSLFVAMGEEVWGTVNMTNYLLRYSGTDSYRRTVELASAWSQAGVEALGIAIWKL
jgi:hypothetical protein